MRATMLVVACTLAWLGASHATAAVQWKSSEGGNDHWYGVKISDRPLRWSQASVLATRVTDTSHLATVTSQGESNFIETLLLASPEPSAWLGGIQIDETNEPAGGWEWVTAEAFAFTNWGPGEPNNTGGVEIFLQLFTQADGTTAWNDGNFPIANAIRRGYVVESETDFTVIPIPGAFWMLSSALVALATTRHVRRT